MSQRRKWIGGIAAAVLVALGGIYAGATSGWWAGIIANVGDDSPKGGVKPGFIGIAKFGGWRLICIPGPSPGVAATVDSADAKRAVATNACRLNQEVSAPDRPNHVIAAANLSLVGPLRKPALMLRLPGTFRPGDPVSLRLGGADPVETAVRECSKNECVAASALSDSEWNHLVAAKTMQIVFPVSGGQSAFVTLAVDGLSDAAAALDVAENVPAP